ncbi:DNA repair protein RecO [Dyella nitratireducens]|uniref:DNA repair protein RecO n=1 Tax=Dyella nitratireducens TaxID=1849580 RepID=A0ABQ1FK27_9GAMM|nr:DNA repair protein RecO [Dyella nitratireducens]GGA17379.1 DNA repair protein RecO [Dyella nitratireducens]GLQ44797.1 DNA repair protein RecO [Dyella nitratireducens]
MLIEQQPAYVLHSRPYRETSLLIECLTRDHGRLGVVARGVRSQRGRLQRSQLEPFQPLILDLHLRGELATLRSAESTTAPFRLTGDANLAGLYLNELMVRLTERQDPHPHLFHAYAQTLMRLAEGGSLAWHLRRFERDLLAVLGYAMQLNVEADTGEPLQPDALYTYRAEHGAMRCRPNEPHAVRGGDLLALHEDRMPDTQGLHALRGMMRELIRFHLGGVELRAWRVLRGALTRR